MGLFVFLAGHSATVDASVDASADASGASSGASSDDAIESAKLIKKARVEKLHMSRAWHLLLQYQPRFFGGFESPAKSPKFFLSTDGARDPEAELLTTIEELSKSTRKVRSRDEKFEDPVACVFPARKLWLEKTLGVKFPSPACERFDRFVEILQPQSLTYVFSSYYLNNPASAFGHTFLRINKAPSAKDGERYELSDYGVGYAAMKVSDNPFVYSFLGVSGLMPGSFDINPYYYKVREYNDFESRDLWEYDLNFSPEEVAMAVAYIWELLDASFNYHYFKENCSYRILSILEVARPSLHLTDVLKAHVMPADTVQTLYEQKDLVTRIHFRPSVRSTFENRYRRLDSAEKQALRRFAKNESLELLTSDLSVDGQRKALDAAIDYLDYRYPKEILRKEAKYDFKKQILIKRAETGGLSSPLNPEPPWSEAPHSAQGSRRLGFGYRDFSGEKSYLLDFKLALHDLLDPKLGYPPTAQITMGHFGVLWTPESKTDGRGKFDLDHATLYEVISLAPVDAFTSGSSWRLKFAYNRGVENDCVDVCGWTELSGGTGPTMTLWSHLDLTMWLRMAALTSPKFIDEKLRVGAGPGISVRWNYGRVALMAETFFRYDFKGREHEFRRHSLGLNLSLAKELSLRASAEAAGSDIHRSDLRLLYYY